MSEEEKEAIKVLEEAKDRLIKPKMLKDVKYTNEDFAKAINIILNLIDKQQKEIEELTRLKNIYKNTRPIGEVFHDLLKEKEYINKDKIRDILKDLDEFDTTFFNANSLKEAIKNSLNRLLEGN